MRSISPLSLSLCLACGPLAAPADGGSTSDKPATTTAHSATTTDSASSIPPTPTTTSTTDETTGLPNLTTDSTTTVLPGFIIPSDAGGGSSLHCDVWAQDCPPGQKCVPYSENGGSWDALKCVDGTGDGAPGDPCTVEGSGTSGIDDCAFGSYCWNIDKNLHGTCIAQCTGTLNDAHCPEGFYCPIGSEGVLYFCFPTCDPLLQDCPDDDLCIPNSGDFLCVLDASGDDGQVNDPCESANACDKGLVCINTVAASAACDQGSAGCCQPFCKFPNSPCPNPDQQCVQWFDPMMPIPEGYENIGVCAIPE